MYNNLLTFHKTIDNNIYIALPPSHQETKCLRSYPFDPLYFKHPLFAILSASLSGSITSNSHPIIQVQNRINRVLTFKTHPSEGKYIVRHDILDIQNLYKIEVTKIAMTF